MGAPKNVRLFEKIPHTNKEKTGCRGRSKLGETREVLRMSGTLPAWVKPARA
jgi:hypothetical protein